MINILLHKLFESKVAEVTDRIAVEHGQESVTYRNLNDTCNQLSRLLQREGVVQGTSVAVALPAGIDVVRSLLSVFKLGAVYVPVSSAFPTSRLGQIFSDTQIRYLITNQEGATLLTELVKSINANCKIIVLPEAGDSILGAIDLSDENLIHYKDQKGYVLKELSGTDQREDFDLSDFSSTNLDASYSLDSDSYIFYTSGSTGKAKGIIGSHKSISHYIQWHAGEWAIDPDFRISQLAPVTFDASLKDILVALISGARLCIPTTQVRENTLLLGQWLRDSQITLLQTVPSVFRMLTKSLGEQSTNLPSLKYVVLAGEKLYGRDIQQWESVQGRGARISNLYGLTETTVLKSFYHLDTWDWDASAVIPVGSGIDESLLAVINEDQICQEGEIGEIFIKSPYVSKGYVDASLNEGLFVQNPLVTDREDYVCRTGDMGRYNSEGLLEVLGRIDDQIKLHGVRVELEEVRGAMLSLSGIEQVELVLHQTEEYQQELICYYTGSERSGEELRRGLSSQIPQYSLPGYYVWLEEFPLNLNGKVDKKALPRPESLLQGSAYEAPQDELERSVSVIWQEVLGLRQPVGRQDSFFNLGGSSLKAIQLISRLYKQHEVQLSIGEIFSNPELSSQAELIRATKRSAYRSISRVAEQEHYALSHAQRRLWVLDQLQENLVAYSRPIAFRLHGQLNRSALEAAFATLIDRHESLRTVFEMHDNQPVQRIVLAENLGFELMYQDLRGEEDVSQSSAAILEALSQQPFDLSEGPLLRARLLRQSNEEYLLLFAIHHIISDEWSMQVLIQEIVTLYNAYNRGAANPLKALPIQYKDYAAWQLSELSGDNLIKHRSYWQEKLGGNLPILNLAGDYARPSVQSYRGRQLSIEFKEDLSDLFESQLNQRGITLFMGLVGLVKVLLYRYTGQSDLIIGTPVAGRDHVDLDGQIGFYINNLALRTSFNGSDSFEQLLSKVKQTALDAYSHQVYPFDLLVDELDLPRDLSRFPLFDVVVVLQNDQAIAVESMEMDDLEVIPEKVETQTSLYDLTFWFRQTPEGLKLSLEYNTDIYAEDRMERMGAHLQELMSALSSQPQRSISEAGLLTQQERQCLLEDFNATHQPYANDQTLVGLFEAQVKINGDSLALQSGATRLSYAELNARSNQLAHYLKEKYEIGPDTVIGLMMQRSEWLLIGILGVLKAGGAYLPIDRSYPQDRVSYMLSDAQVSVLLTDGKMEDGPEVSCVSLTEEWPQISKKGEDNPPRQTGSEDLAYVIYTSGSTGKPKGVMIQHSSVINLLSGIASMLSVTQQDKLLAITTSSFDISVLEFFVPLLNGCTLILADEKTVGDPELLISLMESSRPTIMQATPSLWGILLEAGWKGDQQLKVLSGGEYLPQSIGEKLLAFSGGLWNVYGPTETTIWSTGQKVETPEMVSAIGLPIQNTQVYILDDQLNLVPFGVAGALYIGGAGLARGYCNNKPLTDEKFIENPFKQGTRIYNTGDLCKWNRGGYLEFVGRKDTQVKIRGHRIELGEIETVLASHESISNAVVTVYSGGTHKTIAAYYTGSELLEPLSVRSFLKESLPEYMLPTHYTQLEQFQLNSNGKIDKSALPEPQQSASSTVQEPRNATDRKLVEIWKTVLGLTAVGIDANFFEVGGHSINAIQAVLQIHKTFAVKISLKAFFARPVLSDQSDYILSAKKEKYQPIAPIPEQDTYAVSPAQRRMWVQDRFQEDLIAYSRPMAYELTGQLDMVALKASFDALIKRHESLRTVFTIINDEPRQKILAPAALNFDLKYFDLRADKNPSKTANKLLEQLAQLPFDLEAGPLLRAQLIQRAEEQYTLYLSIHHIITDGWSTQVLIQDFLSLYNAFSRGKENPLTPLSIQYKDYAAWQLNELSDQRLATHRAFWHEKLEGELPVLELQGDYTRPPVHTYDGAETQVQLSAEESALFKQLVKTNGASLFVGVMALVNTLLHRYTGQEDFIVGTPVTGREHADLEDQIGFYVNNLPLRTTFSGEDSFRTLLDIITNYTLEAYDHQVYPFDLLVDELDLPRDLSRFPLFDVMVLLQSDEVRLGEELEMNGVEVEVQKVKSNTSLYDLTFGFIDRSSGLCLNLEYNTDIYAKARIDRMGQHLVNLIRAILRNPNTPIADLPILSEAEQAQQLKWASGFVVDTPQEQSLVEMFEKQVTRVPDAIATIFKGHELTYRELNIKANRVAHYLREKYQVVPEQMIALMIDRGEWQIIGLLGILKAGAAYLPIDPSNPEERIRFMLEDANVNLILTETESADLLTNFAGNMLVLDEAYETLPTSGDNPHLVNQPSDLAYVIYTSGSTGNSKGVMVEHRNCLNMVYSQKIKFDLNDNDRIVQFSSIAFDGSVYEIFMALCHGLKLLLFPSDVIQNPELLLAEMGKLKASFVAFPSAYFNYLNPEKLDFLRVLLTVGDVASVKQSADTSAFTTVYNGYGPTEATVCTTLYEVSPEHEKMYRLPVGVPFGNTQVFLLDRQLNLVPEGIPGEICIAGSGVARGYLNRPELTDNKFVKNPFGKGRLYRTGDLGLRLADGNLDFIGRADNQVKISGYRVELGEIENLLVAYEGIDNAIVIVDQQRGNKTLVAYFESDESVTEDTLKAHLRTRLSEYMIPSYFIGMSKLPVNANGKVDKKALPPVDVQEKGSHKEPADLIERQLLDIWCKVLGRNDIGINDHFFNIGGHSLRAIHLASEVHKTMSLKLEIKDIFLTPVLSAQAAILRAAQKQAFQPILQVSQQDTYALSPAQRRLWVLEQMNEEVSAAYNIPLTFWLKGDLNIDNLENAFNTLIDRHESLRTVFKQVDGQPVQIILNQNDCHFKINVVDFSENDQPSETAQENALKLALEPFDLENAPLFRVDLLKVSTNEHLFFLSIHHIISDERSVHVLIKEVLNIYKSFQKSNTIVLPSLPVQYKDYAAWQNQELSGNRLSEHRAYWLEKLGGEIEVLDIPSDYIRPPVQTYNGGQVHLSLSEEISQQFRDYLQSRNATLFMGLVALVKALLYRYTGQEDIIVGSPSAGRDHPDLRDQIGFYINTLVLRTQLSKDDSFDQLLAKVKETALEAYSHQVYPFDLLVEELDLNRDMSRSPLFDVVVVLENVSHWQELPEFDDIEVRDNVLDVPVSKIDLRFFFVENESNVSLTLDFNTDIYSRKRIENLTEHLEALLNVVLKEPEKELPALNYLPARETTWLVNELNDRHISYPENETLVDLFEQQVAETPNAIATVFEGKELTYLELNAKVNRLAHHLRSELKVERDEIVGLMVDRGEWMIIAILGILKAGAAYLPVDPNNPQERNNFMLKDAEVKLLVTETVHLFNVGDYTGALFAIDVEFDTIAENDDNPVIVNQTTDLAYVIYTSGSTGTPKGVLVEHRNSVSMVWNQRTVFGLSEADRVVQFSSMAFDGSIFEILLALCSGASLLLIRDQLVREADKLIQLMEEAKVNTAILPAAYLSSLPVEQLGFMRRVVTVGDVANLEQVVKCCDYVESVYNGYGPTECAVWSSIYQVKPEDINLPRIPIGLSVSNTQIYLLDQQLNLVPEGIPGEICIAGDAVSRGYLNRPELTKEKFVKNPFGDGILYKTGDKGRLLSDGNIDFLGRVDNQVKIRGYRIELGEVEKIMLTHQNISEAFVTTFAHGKEKGLIGYFTASEELNSIGIKNFMKTVLPDYMIPVHFIELDQFPLNASGKINKHKLPKPETVSNARPTVARDSLEADLVLVWQEVLGTSYVGIHDNFFEIGGHSLKAIQLITKIHKVFEVQLNIGEIFNYPVFSDQANLIREAQSIQYEPIEKVGEQGSYVLSHAQRRLWLQEEQREGLLTYNIFNSYRLHGDLDREALEKAFNTLLDRHESLRTVFELIGGEPRQRIMSREEIGFSVGFEDLSAYADAEERSKVHINEMALTPFDLRQGPLLRVELLKLGAQEHLFLFSNHHIISDEWSMQVLVRDVLVLYNAYSKGEANPLATLPIQYKDYAAWQVKELSGEKLEEHRQYWLDQFSGELPVLELPSDRPRPPVQSYKGEQLYFKLPSDLSKELHELLSDQSSTLFMGLLSLIKTLLYRYTGQTDLIIGTPVAGRDHPDLEDQIGYYLNTLALRTRFSGEDNFLTLLEKVKQVSLEAYEHQIYPFDYLIEELGLGSDLSRSPLFDIVLILQNVDLNILSSLEMDGIDIEAIGEDLKISKGDLRLQFIDRGTHLDGSIEYNTDLYDRERMERMVAHLENLLSAILSDPTKSLLSLEYLSKDEKALSTWFSKTLPKQSQPLVHELIEAQVLNGGDRIAVEQGSEQLSYQELNGQSNQLSALLLDQGVELGNSVGVLLPAGLSQVSSLLGIFKIGAVYVPLSTSFPADRLAQQLEDAQISHVLTNEEGYQLLSEQGWSCQVLVLPESGRTILGGSLDLADEGLIGLNQDQGYVVNLGSETTSRQSFSLSAYSDKNPEITYSPDAKSYIFYTSGSTGKPKGIVGSHEGISHYVQWHAREWDINSDFRISQLAPVTFDASLKDILVALISGARLCIPTTQIRENMLLLGQWLLDSQITLLQTVPSVFRMLTKSLGEQSINLPSLKYVVLAGEKLYGRDIQQWESVQGRDTRISNLYGLTETTVLKSCYHLNSWDWEASTVIPVGTAIQESMIGVMHEGGLCMWGEIGEIYIKSPYVSKGYVDESLNEGLFVQNPLVTDREDYVCRTGDMGRYNSEGLLEVLGRIDDQIKLHGVRVELEEVRGAMLSLSGIEQVELVLHQTEEYQQELICYYTGSERSGEELRRGLSSQIPQYSLPGYYVWLEEFPLNLNGKVDKKALPRPESLLQGSAYEAPQDELERSVSVIWQEVLGLRQPVGRQDSFFNLGGSSLKAIQLISRLYKQHEVQLSIGEIFSNPELSSQAELIRATKRSAYRSISRVAEQEHYALSHAQRRLWVLEQRTEEALPFNGLYQYRLYGKLDRQALARAFDTLLDRHESLRTVFELINGEVRQRVLEREAIGFAVDYEDLSESTDPQGRLEEHLEQLATTAFDLSKGPLLRVKLLRLGREEHAFLFSDHHIISDEWSMQVLFKEVLELYNAYYHGQSNPLTPLAIQYKDYVGWQLEELSGEKLEEHRRYWLDQFSGELPVLELPSDRPRPPVQSHRGDQLYFKLPEELSGSFQAMLSDQGSTLFMGLVALVKTLLYRYTGQSDLIIGTPVAGRDHPDLEDQIGYYLNTLGLRTRFSGSEDYLSLLSQVKRVSLDGFAHQVYPFDYLIEELGLGSDPNRAPLFDVAVILQNVQKENPDEMTMAGVEVEQIREELKISKGDLRFQFVDRGTHLEGTIEYNTDIYNTERIEHMAVHLQNLLSNIMNDLTTPVQALEFLTNEEKKDLQFELDLFNSEISKDY